MCIDTALTPLCNTKSESTKPAIDVPQTSAWMCFPVVNNFFMIYFLQFIFFVIWFHNLMTSNNSNSTYNLFKAICHEKLTIFLSNNIEHYSNDGVTFIVAQSIQYNITSIINLLKFHSMRLIKSFFFFISKSMYIDIITISAVSSAESNTVS